ncbi:VacB/RNase II family 3'-5' exoribonuclease [Reinekea sp.]|uniref:VacB/RNase II family 3'-5' exoribonuclease n=1 Tax=Reinekea sp. TaxID=1970455 RepID=UPI002A82850F|nr:VacB/RNase II family 3'-5' exoribonuclease [Reinekea sp.]
MLDLKSLELLQSLKTDIKASKPVLQGLVKGTGKSFGFVTCTTGEEYFLPPDDMARVLPGDEVTFTVTELADGKTRAELESLVASTVDEFFGIYHVRGKAQGVEPFNSAFSGWLFVPPKQTLEAGNNEMVVAKLRRHPWETGKAQAEIIRLLGSADNNRSWYSLAIQEHRLEEHFSELELAEAEALRLAGLPALPDYVDLTDRPFVTIDSASTQDMDDALHAHSTDQGWLLSVAIADASLFITPDSLLDQAARRRLSTTYLPGLTLPMVPEALANNAMSLQPNSLRPALVFELTIATDGAVTDLVVRTAQINSRAKLSYSDVALWLTDTSLLPAEYQQLLTLQQATSAMAGWRRQYGTPMQDRPDYRVRVDADFNVIDIDKETRNAAREIVEEAMIATNASVANWLKADSALFMTHRGFKPERESELKGLLRDTAAEVADLDGHDLADFRTIMAAAAGLADFPLLTVLQKRFDRGAWSNSAAAHFGLGLAQYTTATSPIRKYSDLTTHRLIKAKLLNQPLQVADELVSDLNERGNIPRQVGNLIENKLRLQWLKQQPDQVWNATIVHITAMGIIAQLDGNGASGLIDMRRKKDDYSHDALRMVLKFTDHTYQLGEALLVKVARIEDDKMMLALV